MENNIEDDWFPNHGKLIIDQEEQTVSATIIDAEIDLIECSFLYDECIHLDTSKLEYLTLSVDNLENMIELINEAENYYNNLNK